MSRPFVGCPRPQGWRCGTLEGMTSQIPPRPYPGPRQPSALDRLVEALQAQTAAIESLVAVNAALLERLPLPSEDEAPEAEAGIPQPLSRPR